MYTREIHTINLKQAHGRPLTDDEMLLIDAAMTHHEQCALGFTALRLEGMKSLEAKLDYATITYEDFAAFIGVDENDMHRFTEGKVSAFEAQMIDYLVCQYIYADGRTHCCSTCGKVFFSPKDNDYLCEDCLGRFLIWFDGRTEHTEV